VVPLNWARLRRSIAADAEIGAHARRPGRVLDRIRLSFLAEAFSIQGFMPGMPRIAHWLWRQDRKAMALFFQSRVSELFAGTSIRRRARARHHARPWHRRRHRETAVVDDYVSIMQG